MATNPIPAQADSPEARRYNRIRRWLGIADFVVGLRVPRRAARDGLVRIGCAIWPTAWDSRIIRCPCSCTCCCCSGSARCWASASTTTDSAWSGDSSFRTRDSAPGLWDEMKGFPGRLGARQHCGGVAVLHDPAMAAALVAAGLGAVHGPVHAAGATCARSSCSRSSTNSSRSTMKTCAGAWSC